MFKPNFTITHEIAQSLIQLERLRIEIEDLPITTHVLSSLRESSRLSTIHYSTMIEGNRLTIAEIEETLKKNIPLAGKKRDQHEVLGYYAALVEMEHFARKHTLITEEEIKKLHALVMSGGNKKIKASPYRTVQNAIYESATKRIIYLPPEAIDVPQLMKELVDWIEKSINNIPSPLIAAIAHYQFATIHPYLDGNGRTARLLTSLILHISDYGLKGIYSLDEYYAKNLSAYYEALNIGESHNYYMGRAEADITSWLTYFCKGMVISFENVKKHALQASKKNISDLSSHLRKLDPRQRMVLTLFSQSEKITSHDVAQLFDIQQRSARNIIQQWVKEGFLIIENKAKKSRRYYLAPEFLHLL